MTSIHNNHEYVDLGLPSGNLWATCNIGANTPEEYGDYFAWGETIPKKCFDNSNYLYKKKYYPDTLPLDADAASINWGGKWRIPTKKEFEELITNCRWIWSNGYKVIGTNDNSIFLPPAGAYDHVWCYYEGICGVYWSSSTKSSSVFGANDLIFRQGEYLTSSGGRRYYGQSVRAVCNMD